MSRLPAVEKLPLAVRKNLRDDWESKKDDLAKRLSDILGQEWTLDVNPNQLYAYAVEGYAKECPGSMITQYVEAAINQLPRFIERQGEQGKQELNTVCSAHTLTIDVDLEKKFLYNGCAVTSDGKLAILFAEDRLAVNIDDPLQPENLTQALNDAPTTTSSMSYVARESIQKGWDVEIARTQAKLAEMLQTDITVQPDGFQAIYDTLKASSESQSNWEENLGNFSRFYFEGLVNSLQSRKFDSDEMMREALVEAMEKKVVALRLVEEGKMTATYNECVFEDGVLFMQTVPKYFGTNVNDVAQKIEELL